MGPTGMTDKEKRTWGARWERTRKMVQQVAKKKGKDLSQIPIVSRN